MAENTEPKKQPTIQELSERVNQLEKEVASKDAVLKKSEKIFTVRQAEFSNAVQPDPKF